jgi:protein-S-isoprenylcysteine O-methyltransferase Ste14
LGYGVIFFGHGLYLGPWNARFVPLAPAWVVGGCLIQVIGMGFAIAARHFLGSNWSSRVTIKVDHRLITGGPYALARHPIYTGMLLGLAGTVIAYGTVVGLVGFLLVAIAYWHKMATEERFLREQFGSDYEDYRRRVKALVPFVL